MAYLSTVDNGTTIVVTCPDDTITFTIATENAILMEDTPLRAHIKDDNGDWYVYSNGMMFNYGTAQTGMSGNDYSRQGITGNWSWYPLNSTNNANASNITTALQDTTMADPTTGSWVTDLNIPANIGVDGFAADGAVHVEPASDVVKITMDRTRYNQPYVIHEQGFRTGTTDAPVEHLVGYWKMDDDAASTTIVAEVGSNGTLAGGDNTSVKASTDAVQGSSLLLNGTDDVVDLDDALVDMADVDKGSILITFKPAFNYDVSTSQGICSIYYSGSKNIGIAYNATTDQFTLYTVGSGTSYYYAFGSAYTDNNSLQQWRTALISWDLDNSYSSLTIGDETIIWRSVTGWISTPNSFRVGFDRETYSYGNAYIDSVKLFNGCILPYGGGPFLDHGNDYANPHESVTAFIKGDESNSDSLKVGTGTITVGGTTTHATGVAGDANGAFQFDAVGESLLIATGNLPFDKACIRFWYKSISDQTNATFLSCQAGYTQFSLYRQSLTDAITFRYNGSSSASFASTDVWDGNWHYLDFKFWHDGTDLNFELYVDKTLVGENSFTVAEETSYGTAIYIGADGSLDDCNGYIDSFTITNDPNTPDQWSAMGAPRLLPNLEVTE